MLRWCLISAGALALVGCAAQPRDDFKDVQQSALAQGQTVQWNQSTQADTAAAAAVGRLLATPLSREGAVQIALLNNRSLQATFEDIGVAQADLVQAGLLKNPVFDVDFKFIQGGGKPHIEAAVSEDFLTLLQIPLRKKLAEANLRIATLRVSRAVQMLATAAEQAFLNVQAAQQILELRQTIEQAADAAAEAAKQLYTAGNVSELAFANQQALHEQAKLDVTAAEAEFALARSRLNELMGQGDAPAWTITARLSEVPADDGNVLTLEGQALARRPDLIALRDEAESAARALGIAKLSWLSDAQIGAMAEREHGDSWQAGPSVALPIPLFDQGQGARARATAELRRAQQLHAAKVVQIRAEIRVAIARVAAARARAVAYQQTLLPLRHKIVQQTQLQYNGMFLGVFELLQARQAEIDAGREYIEALNAYWIARSDLASAAGQSLPATASASRATATLPSGQPINRSMSDMKMN